MSNHTVFTVNNNAASSVSISPSGNLAVGSSAAGPFGATGKVITYTDRVTQREINSEVFSAKVETLVDLWQTRYGNEWVDLEEVEKEHFYELVYKRLRQLGQLEQHYLTDRSRFVCRKPE